VVVINKILDLISRMSGFLCGYILYVFCKYLVNLTRSIGCMCVDDAVLSTQLASQMTVLILLCYATQVPIALDFRHHLRSCKKHEVRLNYNNIEQNFDRIEICSPLTISTRVGVEGRYSSISKLFSM
jgi:hypothetical protein